MVHPESDISSADREAALATTEPKTAAELLPAKRAPGRPTTLTPAMTKEISDRVKLGRFAWVAAVGAGCTPATYYRWMARGEREYAEHERLLALHEQEGEPGQPAADMPPLTLYATFWYEVTVARAFARGVAEVKVAQQNPLAWLKDGPGKDRPGEPGWTSSNKVELTGANGGPLTIAAGVQQYDLTKLSADQLDQLDDALALAAGRAAPHGEGGEGPA